MIDYDVPAVGGGLGSKGGGQTFTPGDAEGAESLSRLNLLEVSFFRGSGGTGSSQVSPTTYLVIYDGNPDTATQVGASTHSIDIAIGDPAGTQYTWTFDNVLLEADTEYWAVLSNDPVDDNFLQPGGTWLQMSLQTIAPTDYPGGVSIIAERNKHQTFKTDLRFTASFAADATLEVTNIKVVQPDRVELTFTSVAGNLYEVFSGTDLSALATSEGTVVASGPSTVFPRSAPLMLREFFTVTDLGLAPPLLEEGFESGDGGFTNANKGTGTDWAHGAPDSSGEGGSVASGNASSANCWATNLGDFTNTADVGFYSAGTDVCLRSPIIDLTDVAAAKLSFAEALDLAESHSAVVNIIDDDSDEVIVAALHTSSPDTNILESDWETVPPIALPPEALGRPVRIEWRLTGEGDGTYMGWYIDDVVLSQ